MHEEARDELTLFSKHLNAVAPALADIDQSVHCYVNAMQRRRELPLIRR
jgi:hypothetical protein